MSIKYFACLVGALLVSIAGVLFAIDYYSKPSNRASPPPWMIDKAEDKTSKAGEEENAGVRLSSKAATKNIEYMPREIVDSAGYNWVLDSVEPWPRNSKLPEIANRFKGSIARMIDSLSKVAADTSRSEEERAMIRFTRASFLNYEGDPIKAYEDLTATRRWVESEPEVARQFLYTIVYFQGVTALRRGENENCIMCRGESSCILPISKAAQHTEPLGSEVAIKHFTEYLEHFPADLEVQWLLNIAYMTLGKHPEGVPAKYLISLDHYNNNEFDIGKFRDIGAIVGINRFNQAGGALMEDLNNDRLLDIAVSTFDPTTAMALYFNDGKGKFTDVTKDAGLLGQLGGLNCVQTDYNNDGWLDIFIVRGAWLPANMAIRPSLLKNNGDNTFEDVTEAAGLQEPVNSISSSWCDYDNDGWLDVFVCCEQQSNRLYHNNRDGTFTECAFDAGVSGVPGFATKGAAWIDFDNDGFQDLFVNHLSGQGARLYKNMRDGSFMDVTQAMGIQGPLIGFSCWAWDFNNDGWQDIFATCYERTMDSCVRGLMGSSARNRQCALYRNMKGKGFQDVTAEAGLTHVYYTMGSNFGDFDNDGYLDFYLGTGEPSLGTLVPNRMFKNVQGRRFSEITSSSGTGNLQKGHGVACGDWNRDGNVDLFIEMGGAVNGDKYHNILFQNPGNENDWVTLKLIGKTSNRAAIGARIKLVTSDETPKTLHRHVSNGSSFGGNPLEQTIGLGKSNGIASVEITWPATGEKQVFENVPMRKYVEIVEGETEFQVFEREPIAVPAS